MAQECDTAKQVMVDSMRVQSQFWLSNSCKHFEPQFITGFMKSLSLNANR
jgi:hypothetical protein